MLFSQLTTKFLSDDINYHYYNYTTLFIFCDVSNPALFLIPNNQSALNHLTNPQIYPPFVDPYPVNPQETQFVGLSLTTRNLKVSVIVVVHLLFAFNKEFLALRYDLSFPPMIPSSSSASSSPPAPPSVDGSIRLCMFNH